MHLFFLVDICFQFFEYIQWVKLHVVCWLIFLHPSSLPLVLPSSSSSSSSLSLPPPFQNSFFVHPCLPGTHSVDQAELRLRHLPDSVSQVLRLKTCATMINLFFTSNRLLFRNNYVWIKSCKGSFYPSFGFSILINMIDETEWQKNMY